MILSLSELKKLVSKIKEIFPKSGIILLKGNLASGKTTLVKEFVKSLSLNQIATSPTFLIQNIYDNKVFHYDIYNEGSKKFIESGLLEELEKEGYHFIEWADESLEEILKTYGFSYIVIEIKAVEKDKREYKICTN